MQLARKSMFLSDPRLVQVCKDDWQFKALYDGNFVVNEAHSILSLALRDVADQHNHLLRICQALGEASLNGLDAACVSSSVEVMRIVEIEIDVLMLTPCGHEPIASDILAGKADESFVTIWH
jgi:hypothetical protein